MPTPLFASPFPSLSLTLQEKANLRLTAVDLVEHAQRLYENHLWEANEKIDAERWSLVREREDVRVFHDRHGGSNTRDKNMHLLLTVGFVKGSLHDAMYGVVNHSTDDMRIKTAYVHDTLLDSAVLKTLLEPTVEQPFQSMTVRWFVKGIPLMARLISNPIDNVYIEATGFKRLLNGERVGFHLMHSLDFDKTPPLSRYLRVNSSMCTIWKQHTPDRVQAFMTAYTQIPHRVPTSIFVRAVGDALVSLWRVVDCAQHKKLAWLIRHRPSAAPRGDEAGAIDQGCCCVCGNESKAAQRGIKSACAVCANHVCSKCCIHHEIHSFTPDRKLLKHKTRFCLRCVTQAASLDAAICARDEAAAYDAASAPRAPYSGLRKMSAVSSSASSQGSDGFHHQDGQLDRRRLHRANNRAVSASSTSSISDSASWVA